MHSAVVGFGLGFFVALQLGPMSLLLMRTTLRGGARIGLAIAAGIAAIDGLYAAAGAGGVTPLLGSQPLRTVLGLSGAGVLVVLGLRTLRSAFRVRLGGEAPAEVRTPRRAFLTSLAGTASNPLTIASWAAVFAAASTAGAAKSTGGAVLLVAGVAVGSLVEGALLTGLTAAAGRVLGDRVLRAADVVAGTALLSFGGVLAFSTVRER